MEEQNYIQKVLRIAYYRSISNPGYKFSAQELLDELLNKEKKQEIFKRTFMKIVDYFNTLSDKGILATGGRYTYKRKNSDDKTSYMSSYCTYKNLEDKSLLKFIGVSENELDINENKGDKKEQMNFKKVFISHSSKDKKIVEEIIEILETIGLESNQIFCSSFEGYGVELGENFFERIKSELNDKILVLFLLSDNFYNSPVCLCEMGATWIKTNEHIPILIPPIKFTDIKGVIPHTQGFLVNDVLKFNSLKLKIEKLFVISNVLDSTAWERKRNNIIERINNFINLSGKEEKIKHNNKIISRNRKSDIDWDKY